MPRRKQLAPKRLKGNIEKSSEGDWKEGENAQDEEEDEDVETSKDEEDKTSDGTIEVSNSPNASWSFKFTPFGSNTERVMRTSAKAGGSGISKVFSKGIWYPDDTKCSTENSNPLGESSHSEGENDKLRRKAVRSESHSSKGPEKEKKCERRTTRVNSGQSDHEVEDTVQRHCSSSLIRENLRHYFLDKLKSSGKVVKDEDDHNSHRQLQREERVGRTSPERSSSHGTRSNYTHTVLWMPPKVSDMSPNEPTDSGEGTSSKDDHSKGKRSSFLESSKFQERLNLAKEVPSSSSSSHHQGQEGHKDEGNSRCSPSHSSTSDCPKKSPPRVHEENGDSSVSGASSPSDYYHRYHSAGMAYYQSPFMGYGLYPSYPNFVYPYNYGYVVAVPGGLFIPMGNSYSQTSGMAPASSLGPHKDAPLDLSSCSTTKKEEDVKPDMVKKEEPPPPSSSSVKHQTKRAAGSSKKAKGEKTMVLWKKVPRHAMMMDMAQLSVLEKVHVLYTTESVFLCFICSDCHALFNSLDLLVLHAVGTAHTSRNDLDDRAMELKGFDVIPVDKITKKQKNSDKKPEFSFESPLQSTVSLHRRRLPAGKDFLLKSRDVYKCSVCPETFPNFLRYTMHMNETGHRRKSVRYSDVYKAQRQVKKILKCMNCEKSFMTLEELTLHMIKTKHYSDIAGGFANQVDLEEDAEYDHLDPGHENHLNGAEHQSTVHPTLPPSHKPSSHDGNIADGTSSESENPTSLRGSPGEHCRSRSPAVRSKEPEDLPDEMDQTVTETWKDNDEMVARSFDDSCQRSMEPMATENESQYSVAGPTSQSLSPSLPGTKRDMRELDVEETDSVSKKVKVESESLAGDEDDYQTFGGYETENEYEDEEEEEFASGDYDMGSLNGSHARRSDQENCFLTSDLSRKKLRRRIYKHSLLYQCRKNRTEGKKEVSAFDGLYNWAKSLGLLSSAAVTQPTPVAQMPKAVVKCDGKYVDPDNFDVTLPYGGKVRPDVNPLSKLSSMVETTQIKQPNTKSFESNFIMDRAYFNFEKNPSHGAVAINPSFQSDSEGGNDSHTFSRTWLNSPTEEELCSETSSKTLTEHLSKQMQNAKESNEFLNSSNQLPSTSSHSQLQGWPVEGTISKDAVLERLILKAYNRPPRSGFTLRSTSEEHCTCSTKPEIKTSTGDLKTRPSKTKPDGQHDTENDATRTEDPEKCESLLGDNRNVCYKCSGKNRTLESKVERGLSSDSNTLRQDQGLSEAANTTQRGEGRRGAVNEEDSDTSEAAEGPEDKQKRKSEGRSVETYGNLFFSRDRCSSKSLSERDVDRGCLQDLIYGPRDSPGVREVKFTWAEAIDTLISRIFEPESVPMEQSIPDSVHGDTPSKSESKEMTSGSEAGEGEGAGGGDGREMETKVSPKNSECKGKINDDQTGEERQDEENKQVDRKENQREDESDEDVGGEASGEVNTNNESRGKAVNSGAVSDDHLHGVKGKNGDGKKVPDMKETTKNDCHPDEKYSYDNIGGIASCSGEDDGNHDKFKEETDKSRSGNGVDKPVQREGGSSDETGKSSPEVDNSSEHRSDSPHERFGDGTERTSNCSDASAYYNDMSSMSRYSGHGFKYSIAKRYFDLSSPSDGPNDFSERTENFSNDRKKISEEVEETPNEAGRSAERCRDEASHGSDSFCPKYMRPPKFYKEKHHLPGYFHYSGPPPLIPNADASTKAIQRLEELTRKPSVTNVKEMILNKIQEEVERLTAPDYESSQVSFHLPPRPSYLLPCVGNNNDGDASGKSLKSLEELSKCSPLSPFQRMPTDTRLMVNKDGPTYRHDVGLKYLPPSATPESNVSVIQSLEKLSNEHPVLRRKEQPVSQPPASSLRETPLSAPEKLQYLPPSFGTEASHANSIQSLERFSSQHPFFSISEGPPHSSLSSCPVVPRRIKEESTDDGCLLEKQSQSVKCSSSATPVDFSIKPKEHPSQPMAFKAAGSSCGSEGGIVIKVEPEGVECEQFKSTSSKLKDNRKLADDASDCDKVHSPSSKTEADPLLALDNLVRMKQSTEVSPSPSKIALELVSKDMKSPLYILPPDEVNSQSDKNPLEEMNKMVKLT